MTPAAPIAPVGRGLWRGIAGFAILQWAGNAVMFLAWALAARRLGADAFGGLAFAQAVVQYAVLLVEFGYPAGGTHRIAAARDDPQALSRAFSTILASQLLLAGIVLVASVAVWAASAGDRQTTPALVLAGCTAVAGAALQPAWLMLGLERLRELAWIQLAGKVASLALVLSFVHAPEHAAFALMALGAAPLVAGLGILAWCARTQAVRWLPPSVATVARELREAFVVFAPGVVSSAYTTLPAVVLGLVAPPVAVAHYALADRLKGVVTLVLHPLSSTLVARMTRLFAHAPDAASRLALRSFLVHAAVAGAASAGLHLAAAPLVQLAGGPGYEGAVDVLRWLAFVPLVVALSNVASLHVLLPFGRAVTVHRVVLFVSAVGLVWLWPFVRAGGEIAAARFVLASELLGCALMVCFAWQVLRRSR